MTTSPKKIGIVGTGAIAGAYSLAFENTDKAVLVAAADIDPAAAHAYASKHDAKAFESLEDMIDQAELDGVIISTPPVLHNQHVLACAEKGLHIMCEKPVSVDSENAMQMIESAKQNQVLFTMASKFRFVEDIAKAKKLVEQGVIGDLVLFENAFTSNVDMTKRWNSNPAISGGGVLIDNGTHSLDIMRYFLGTLVRVKAVECQRIQDIVVDDTVRVFVETECGVVGNIDLSWSINKELPTFVSLFGSEGTLHVGWQQSKYKRTGDKDWTVFGTGYDKVAAFKNQIENFVDAMDGKAKLVVQPEDALASVHAVEAAYESMRTSNWQMIGKTSETSPVL